MSAALAAADVGEVVHAMHDPTEGGLATGLFELVAPADLGLRVIRERIPFLPETDAICRALALDPLNLLASGASVPRFGCELSWSVRNTGCVISLGMKLNQPIHVPRPLLAADPDRVGRSPFKEPCRMFQDQYLSYLRSDVTLEHFCWVREYRGQPEFRLKSIELDVIGEGRPEATFYCSL